MKNMFNFFSSNVFEYSIIDITWSRYHYFDLPISEYGNNLRNTSYSFVSKALNTLEISYNFVR